MCHTLSGGSALHRHRHGHVGRGCLFNTIQVPLHNDIFSENILVGSYHHLEHSTNLLKTNHEYCKFLADLVQVIDS